MQTVPAKLIRSNPIKAALTLVPSVKLSAVEAHLQKLEDLETRIRALKAVKDDLLEVEKAARSHAIEQISALEGQRKELRESNEAAGLTKIFPEFSLEPLRWRDEQGLPRLAIFALQDAEFKIEVTMMLWNGQTKEMAVKMSPTLPRDIIAKYADVVGTMLERAPNKEKIGHSITKVVSLSAMFNGVIPAHVKARISAFESHFKTILIIAEVTDWKYGEVVQPKQVDPLVVGWDGETFRLIAAFDLTSVEAAARDYLKMS